jgi:uncharacterized membrane protein
MLLATRAKYLVAILLFPSLIMVVGADKTPDSQVVDTDLQHAAELWSSLTPDAITAGELRAPSGIIPLAYTIFDPLEDAIPGAGGADDFDYLKSGLLVVQLQSKDGSVLKQLSIDYEFELLGHVGEEAWLVRLGDVTNLNAIQGDDRVRWAGSMLPSWRISPALDGTQDYYSLVVSPDIKSEQLSDLVLDLQKMGATDAWCGSHICEVRGKLDLSRISHDGRVIFVEPSAGLILTNAAAGAAIGVDTANSASSFDLFGSGETIMFADTGLDINHPDIDGRVVGVYTQYGLDPSPADSNGGHGTHVALTMAGDGSGDSSATGIAPEASLLGYAFEHDSTGVFGRRGSLYDLFADADQFGSRIGVNAWGIDANHGYYTSDSRSVDLYVNDNPSFLPLFAIGDDSGQIANHILPPSTAKNTLSIGASTTTASGETANISSQGPTLDGRIKPDLIAPGITICSGRAEEAMSPLGSPCGSGSHGNGNDFYMSMSGTSQATAVAGGSAALVREFLREQVGISSPSAALIKAAMINGAQDTGVADIPNANEGWGMIDLDQTILAKDGATDLLTFHDNSRLLNPGYSALYAFEIDASHGMDLTLVWSDDAGSANSAQNSSRLVNDLDLQLIAPDGTIYRGNNFVSGFSQSGGTTDVVNNVERIKIATGSLSGIGTWQVKVTSSSGLDQRFALVMSADATSANAPDLASIADSIFIYPSSPLAGEAVPVRLSWFNQGVGNSGTYEVKLTDVTTGDLIHQSSRGSLSASTLDSYTTSWTFTTTGTHSLKLELDSAADVVELNDENAGINNNIFTLDLIVSATGLRLIPLADDGSEDPSSVDRVLDAKNETEMGYRVMLRHEGTGDRDVSLTVGNPYKLDSANPYLLLSPNDNWDSYANRSGTLALGTMGSNESNISLLITLEDLSANLVIDSQNKYPRYARAGAFYVDVTARYSDDVQVSHTIRLTITVAEVRDVSVGASGNSGLSAPPGDYASFGIGVMNTGNTISPYNLDCYSENQWRIELEDSNSSSYEFEPLEILGDKTITIRIFVPPTVQGGPAAGTIDSISCFVTSSLDLSLNITESVDLLVEALDSFTTELFDGEGYEVGPSENPRSLSVDNAQVVNLSLLIGNTGNREIELTVSVQSERTDWNISLSTASISNNESIQFTLAGGSSATVAIEILVYDAATGGDSNQLTFKTIISQNSQKINSTTLIVSDDIGLSFPDLSNNMLEVSVDGQWNLITIVVENTGNSLLNLNWSNALLDDGWQAGFFNPPPSLHAGKTTEFTFGVISPLQEPIASAAQNILLSVNGSIGNRSVETSMQLQVDVIASQHLSIIEANNESALGIIRDSTIERSIIITNQGNQPLQSTLRVEILDSDGNVVPGWSASISPASISGLAVGSSTTVIIGMTPGEDVKIGLVDVIINAETSDGNVSYSFEASADITRSQGGLFGLLPLWASSSILIVIFLVIAVVAIRIKRTAKISFEGDELTTPDIFSDPAHMSTRRDEVLNLGVKVDELTSGTVDDDEIAAALAQSIPALPAPVPDGRPPAAVFAAPPVGRPPQKESKSQEPAQQQLPVQHITYNTVTNIIDSSVVSDAIGTVKNPPTPQLPPGGLPPGWTMEQWQHYGHQWLSQQGQQ